MTAHENIRAKHLWNVHREEITCERCGAAAQPGGNETPCPNNKCPETIYHPSDHHPECPEFQENPCIPYAGKMEQFLDCPVVYLRPETTHKTRCNLCRDFMAAGAPVFSDLSSEYEAAYCSEICLLVDSAKHSGYREGVEQGRREAAAVISRIITQEPAPDPDGRCCRIRLPHSHCIICKEAVRDGIRGYNEICGRCADAIREATGT